VAYLGGDVGRYDAKQQLLLLFLLTLKFDPRLDAGPRAHEGVVVRCLCHVAVIETGATRTQQKQGLSTNLQQ